MTHPKVANKVIPCKDPHAVDQGIKKARQMLLSTNKRLREGGMGIGVKDPHTPLETSKVKTVGDNRN